MNSFFLEEPKALFKTLSIVPKDSDTLGERLNSITRLVLLVYGLLLVFEYKHSALFLLMSLSLIIISYYNQSNMTKYQDNILSPNTSSSQYTTSSSLETNHLSTTPKTNTVYEMEGCPSSTTSLSRSTIPGCNTYTTLTMEPNYVSLNQKLMARVGENMKGDRYAPIPYVLPIASCDWKHEKINYIDDECGCAEMEGGIGEGIGKDTIGDCGDCDLDNRVREPEYIYDINEPILSNIGITKTYQKARRGYKTAKDIFHPTELNQRDTDFKHIHFRNNIPSCMDDDGCYENLNSLRCRTNNERNIQEMEYRTDMQERLMAKQHMISERRKMFPFRRDSHRSTNI